ncbi:hypothetical protein AB0875_28300 [Micromonospora gifhornensis]|uniref:hypothetical protein n=1 Tax=Micromonospora gifhornensis TaxID=84594 RepID=UPI0034562D6B
MADGSGAPVEVFPEEAEEFASAESGVKREFGQCMEPVSALGREELAGFVGGEGFGEATAGSVNSASVPEAGISRTSSCSPQVSSRSPTASDSTVTRTRVAAGAGWCRPACWR